jgi:YidC/Oxa1 family membrane protein insertase
VQSHQFDIYVGPCKDKALAQGWDTLPSVLRFFDNGPMDAFAKLLLKILNWSHDSLYPNYGLAIIILTIIVRLVTLPLTLKSMRSMKKMQMLAPEIEALKAKYGEDANEMNKKMMELYRERGVNPIGGCFPMLLQMPVFIALYRMLMIAFELRGAPFVFWISDLSQPDRMFHLAWMPVLPFVGAALQDINLLPVLMGISMVVSQKMMPTTAASMNPQQKFMMNFMPVFFSILCYSLASGLSLYILTSTVLGIVQQKLISPGEMTPKTPRKKVVGKGQHFYTAAKARQRQMAKEMRQERQKQARQNKTETKDND